jgi:CDGSH-type Zn-finger protein
VPTASNGGTERGDRRRVVLVPDGPLLVEGPVEIVLADGSTIVSDRFMVAICMCRRSGRYPMCDTSHRRRRPKASQAMSDRSDDSPARQRRSR